VAPVSEILAPSLLHPLTVLAKASPVAPYRLPSSWEIRTGPSTDPGSWESFPGIHQSFSMITLAPELLADLSVRCACSGGRAGPLGKPGRKRWKWSGNNSTCIQELRVLRGLGTLPHDEPPKASSTAVLARMAEFG